MDPILWIDNTPPSFFLGMVATFLFFCFRRFTTLCGPPGSPSITNIVIQELVKYVLLALFVVISENMKTYLLM